MKYNQLCIIAILALTLSSCLEPDPIQEDDMLIEDSEITTVQDEAVASDEQANPEILGLWTSTAVTYTGSITTESMGTSPSTEIQDFYGVGYDLDNHTVSFLNVPNLALGEGIYSISLETTGGTDDQPAQEIVGLTLIASQSFWEVQGDQLTINSGGKARTATIVTLTEDLLELNFITTEEVSLQGGEVIETTLRDYTFEFVR